MYETLLNKKVKIIHSDGDRTLVRRGIFVSQDEHFILLKENGKELLIGKGFISKIEEIENDKNNP